MRRLAPVLLVLTGCASHHAQPAHTGTPATDAPEVLAMSLVRPDLTPSPTIAVVVPATVAPPVVVIEPAPVVPLTTGPPVRAVGECGGWGPTVAEHFGSQAAKACQVIGCETGYTYDPTIVNREGSSASGLMQFIDSTWVKARALVGAEQYPRAKDAPGAVQIAAGAAWLRETSWSQWECA